MKFNIKLPIITLFIAVMVLTFTVKSSAREATSELLYSEIFDKLSACVDEETAQILAQLGIKSFEPESLNEIDAQTVFSGLKALAADNLYEPFTLFVKCAACLMLIWLASSFISSGSALAEAFEGISSLCVALLVFSGVADLISSASLALGTLSALMKSLLPYAVSVCAFSGKPALAASTGAVGLYVCEIINFLSESLIPSLMLIFLCASVCLEFFLGKSLSGLTDAAKRLTVFLTGLTATSFTAFISVKKILSSSIDGAAVRSFKFILGAGVPVVGSSVAEGLSGILASIELIKNTFSASIIIIMLACALPTLIRLIAWEVSLSCLIGIARLFQTKGFSNSLESMKFSIEMLLAILVLSVYMLIISCALTVMISGGSE